MSLEGEIDKAVGAHRAWKQRLKAVIETGESEITVEAASRDDLCAFGQWLYGTTIAQGAKELPDYKGVKALHASFHHYAAEILDLALQGKKAEASALLGVTANYSKVSAQLTQAMIKWQKDAGGRF